MANQLYVVRLKRTLLQRSDALRVSLLNRVGRRHFAAVWAGFAMSPAERAFARTLLEHRSSLWLYRTHQRCFAGDFLVVDMAPHCPADRKVWGVELKRRQPLRMGRGGIQLSRVHAALTAVAQDGLIVSPEASVQALYGDSDAVLRFFQVPC